MPKIFGTPQPYTCRHSYMHTHRYTDVQWHWHTYIVTQRFMHVCLYTKTHTYTYTDVACSVWNKASLLDNDWLKFLWTDWLENLSDNFTLKQIVKRTVQSEKSWVSLTGFKTYFEHWHVINCYFKSTFYVKIGQNCYFKHEIWGYGYLKAILGWN